MARHGQRGESEEQKRRGEPGWRGEGERQSSSRQGWSGGQYDRGRESRSGRERDWAEDSGFDQPARYGNGRGEHEGMREPLEDFSQRRGGPRETRGRGPASGSGWGPEQEPGQGAYRGNRRSWEGEARGAYMDRQRDYRQGEFGGDPSFERGSATERGPGGWSEQERYGRGGPGQGWGQRGREQQAWGEGEFGGFGRGSGMYSPGGEFGGRYEPGGVDPYGGGQRFGREPSGGREGGFGSGGEMGRGQFAGRGPKGYRRSDDRIKEDVCEQLTLHPDIDASEIEVKVQGGEVSLTGTVDSRRAKRLVEDLVEVASGVKDVNNQLRVKQRDGTGSVSDAAGTAETQGSRSRT
jgi:hypothetical protein